MGKITLLLDENIGIRVADALQENGYDIVSIIRQNPGITDQEVLDRAIIENRIIVTLDKDFGRLVYQYSQKHTGVISLRLNDESPQNVVKVLMRVLNQYGSELGGKFTTVSETKIRLKG